MLRRFSIRTVLLGLVSIPLLALFAALAYDVYRNIADRVQEANRLATRLAERAAEQTGYFLAGSEHALSQLAKRPQVRAMNEADCDPLLTDLKRLQPAFANVLTLNASGVLVCSVTPIVPGGAAGPDPKYYFNEVVRTRRFTVGKPAKGFITGRWVSTLAYPVIDDAGILLGAVAASVDLANYQPLVTPRSPVPGVIAVINSDGVLIARSEDAARRVGFAVHTPAANTIRERRQGTVRSRGFEDADRFYGFVPIERSDWIALAGIDAAAVLGPAWREAAQRSIAAVVIALGVLALTLLAMRRLAQPIAGIAATVNAVREGQFHARATVAGPHEIAQTAQQLNAMLDARAAAVLALRESEAKLRKLMDGLGPSMFVGLLTPDGVLVDVNEPALAAAGLKREDVVGKPLEQTHWLSWSAPVQRQIEAAIGRAAGGEGSRFDLQVRMAGDQLVWVDFTLQPLRDDAGGVTYLVPSAMAIDERKQAETMLHEANERLQALSRRVLEVQEQERAAIARELHDEIGQSLTAMKLHAQALLRDLDPVTAQRLSECITITDRALGQTRSLSLDLRPPELDHLGLCATLRDFLGRIAGGAGFKASFSADPEDLVVDRQVAIVVFRVAQEALNNVARHSRARSVAVELLERNGKLQLAVSDDGCGYDLAEARERALKGRSMGVLGMEERAALAGGTLRIITRPGQGTRVQAIFPLGRSAEEVLVQ